VTNGTPRSSSDQGRLIIGGVFIVAGIAWVVAMILPGFFDIRVIGPLALIGFGGVLAASGIGR